MSSNSFPSGVPESVERSAKNVARGSKRCVRPPLRRDTLLYRVVHAAWPWAYREYPGFRAMLAHVCGTTPECAGNILKNPERSLSGRQARRLEHWLRGKAGEYLFLAEQIADHAKIKEEANARLRGFARVAYRDGPDQPPRDGRWRGGKKARGVC